MTSVGLEPLQQKGLRESISPICTLSQNGYGDLECVFPGVRPCAKLTWGLNFRNKSMVMTSRVRGGIPSRPLLCTIRSCGD